MTTLTEDDVLEQLDAQNNLLSFMTTAHNILLQGIKRFLPSLFVDNDEEIVEYAVKPLLAQSGPLDDIDVALRLIYALGKMDKWLYADITLFFSSFISTCMNRTRFPVLPTTLPGTSSVTLTVLPVMRPYMARWSR